MKDYWLMNKGSTPLVMGPDPWDAVDSKTMVKFDAFFGPEFKKLRTVLDELSRTAYLISPKSENVEFDYGFCLNAHESFLATIDAGQYGELFIPDWDYVSLLEIMVFFARNIVRDFSLRETMERPIQTVLMYELDAMGLLEEPDPDAVCSIAVAINNRTFSKLGKGNFLEFKDPSGHGIDCRTWSLIHMQNTWGFEYEWPENCHAYEDLYAERIGE